MYFVQALHTEYAVPVFELVPDGISLGVFYLLGMDRGRQNPAGWGPLAGSVVRPSRSRC